MNKPRAFLLATTALVAVGAVADSAFDAVAGRQARQTLASLGIEAESVSADAWRGALTIKGAQLNRDGLSVRIGELGLARAPMSFGLIAPAQALEGSVKAADVSIAFPFGTYKIPAIEAQNTNLSSADLAGLFDSKAATPLAERLAKLDASAIVAPEMIAETKIGPQTQRVVYKDIKLSNIVAGKVAEASVAGATSTVVQAEMGEMRGIYGPMRVKTIDLPLIARFVTDKAKPGEQRAVLYSDFSLDGFRMTATKNNFEMQLGKVTGKEVKARPLKQGLPALFELAAQGEKKKQDPNAPAPDPKLAAAIVADMFEAFEMGPAEGVGLLVRAADKESKPVTITLSRMGFSGFGGGPRFGEMSYEGLKVASADGNVAIGGLALRDLDFSSTLKAAMAAAEGQNEIEKNPRAAIPTIGQFVIQGVDIDVVAKDGAGNVDGGKRSKGQLGKFEYKGANYILGIPTKVSLALEKLVFDLPPNVKDPQLRELAALGLKRIDVTSRIAAAWDESKKELALSEASFEGDRLGAIKLSLLAGNVEKELFAANAAVAQAAVLGAVLKKLDLSVSDTGLLGLVLAMDAKGKGKPIDQLRSEYVAAAAIGIPAMLGNHPSAKALGAAVSKFLAQPQNLKITATAKDGIGAADVAMMQNPADLLSKIELQATAGQ